MTAGFCGTCMFYFFKQLPKYFPEWLYYFIFPTPKYENSSFSMLLTTFVSTLFCLALFCFGCLNRTVVIPPCSFDISFVDLYFPWSVILRLFSCSFCHPHIFFRKKMSLHVFCLFFNLFFFVVFWLLSFERFLYTVGMSPSSNTCSVNIFSQYVTRFCILLRDYFSEQTFFCFVFNKIQCIDFF